MHSIALIVSEQDAASVLIFKKIEDLCGGLPDWASVYVFKEDIIFVDLSKVMEDDVVFLSRHKSEAGTKSLTVHSIGNFGKAMAGGEDKRLCGCLPQLEANFLRALNKKNEESGLSKDGFVVSLEATHHGPFIGKNCVFIELGSSEKEWSNELASQIIAETVVEEIERSFVPFQNKDKVVIGFGGGHYSPDFTKLVLRQPYAFGHICPKYALSDLNNDLVKQMIEKSRAEEIVLDWKGLKDNKDKVLELCKETNLPIVQVQKLLKQ